MTATAVAPQDWREGRRLRAWELDEAGWSGARIAQALGVTPGAVSQWLTRAREGDREALRTTPRPGKQPRLTAEQRTQIPLLLTQGAEAHGFIGDVWTTRRVAVLIRRVFGVGYHPAHVSRLLRQIGWTLQKPVRRVTQRDEATMSARPSSSTRQDSIRCRSWRAAMPPAARRRCCGRR